MSSGIFEITHDSLAAKIWEKVSAEEKTLIEVKNFITNSTAMYKTRKVLLTKEDLAYIAPYENKLTLDPETDSFINRSKRFYRNRKISTILITALTIAGLVIVIFVINKANTKAIAKAEEAQRALAKADSAQRLAESNALLAGAKSDSLLTQTKIADQANTARQEALVTLQSNLNILRTQKAEISRQKDITDEQKRKIAEDFDKISKQEEDTKETLDNTKLLSYDPTLALRNAVLLYGLVEAKELKNYLKRNAFDAFNEVLYTNELKLERPVTDIAVSYDHRTVLIADSSNLPKVWDLSANTVIELLGHIHNVTLVAAARTRPHYVTVENRKELIFWGRNYEYVDTASFRDEIAAIQYINGDNELLIGFRNGNMAITDLTGKVKLVLHDKNVVGLEEMVVADQPGYNFITRSSDDKIRVWSRRGTTTEFGDTVIFDDSKLTGRIHSLALSPEGDQLSLGTEKGIYCAHTSDGKFQPFHFEIFFPSISRIAFKNNNQLIVSTGVGNSFIYEVERKEYREVKGYPANTRIAQLKNFNEDRHFITAADDGYLKIWDIDISRSLFFRSLDDNPDKVNDASFTLNKQTRQWMLTSLNTDTIFFRNDRDPKPRRGDLFSVINARSDVEWDTAHSGNNTFIRVISPVTEYNNMYFYESAEIQEDSVGLNTVKISDMAGGGDKKMRSRLNIKSVTISDCKRFILIKCIDRMARYFYYYVYPTFEGLYDLVLNKRIIKTTE